MLVSFSVELTSGGPLQGVKGQRRCKCFQSFVGDKNQQKVCSNANCFDESAFFLWRVNGKALLGNMAFYDF